MKLLVRKASSPAWAKSAIERAIENVKGDMSFDFAMTYIRGLLASHTDSVATLLFDGSRGKIFECRTRESNHTFLTLFES